ncbi:DUF3885 domain-containing protein [Saccharibacillus sp. CPCC 101409]|uniref:DUF3885 domain-containing protein n=1 Tax=Saccharibacillus sp. CPCC 101409 TaxID=3058041 RepID=UPI00267277F2|nr:DUF3885 domain-containing protein [Saccharibacillus sp. CPCC 101409]MDO3410592.1 DUF3885 domain-containing protein [Saccharibacillus sp. CPCC 101409]
MDLNEYLTNHFPDLTLTPPLFYNSRVSIRFELGDPPVFWVNKAAYMKRVYGRAIELFRALHDPEDEVLLVTHAYFWNKPKNRVKHLNLYRKYIKNKASIKALRLEVVPDDDCEPGEVPDPRYNTYVYRTACRVEDLNYASLIRAICNHDVGIQPMIYHRVYFINTNKNTIFHIYDDRGCDVIASSRESLIGIYKAFNRWILDYDRERIDRTFLE